MLSTDDSAGVFLWRAGAPLTRARFLDEAAAFAQRLPAGRYLLNLCEQREHFLLAFAAAMFAGRTQLMPAAHGATALAEIEAVHPGCVRVTDGDVVRWRAAAASVAAHPGLAPGDDDSVLVAFTSGTTGHSQPHSKRWRALAASVRLNSAAIRGALGLPEPAPLAIVATVPPHHVYGIEFTALLPLFAGMSVHAERPLFPADVATALTQPARPRVLVSTPLHLRALADSGIQFPDLDLIISATAPLEPALASVVEARLGAPLLEVFGSTETCAIATRRTAQRHDWLLHEGITIDAGAEGTRVCAAWFDQPQQLQDLFEPRGNRHFALLGRSSDLVEVAGKRASLADITRRLCEVPGVEDAVAFQPDAGSSGVANRIAALVVSRTLSAPEIARQVAGGLDAALVPRPLLLVERIPRDPVGKVSRARLLQLARGAAPD